jgi:hypothetical protein
VSRSSANDSQRYLPPMPLTKSEQPSALLTKREQPQPVVTKQEPLTEDAADEMAKALISEALEMSGITNDEAGFVLGLSSNMVRKMRIPGDRARMSQGQFIRLSFFRPSFYIAYQRAIEARTGWLSRHALEAQREATNFFAVVTGR